jgi:hypothetical protein
MTVFAPVEVRVYDATGIGAFVVLPNRTDVRFSDELNGNGSGSLLVNMDDRVVTEHVDLLEYGRIVKFAMPPPGGGPYEECAAFVIEQRDITHIPSGESTHARMMAISGRGLRSLLENAAVLPIDGLVALGTPSGAPQGSYPNAQTRSGRARVVGPSPLPYRIDVNLPSASTALRTTSRDVRFFGWMTAPQYWIDAGDWSSPIAKTVVQRGSIGRSVGGGYDDFPDPSAMYIWPEPGPLVGLPGDTRAMFRASVHVDTDTSVKVHATGDNTMRVYVDEQEVLTGTDYWTVYTSDPIVLSAGYHCVAVEVRNEPSRPDLLYNPAGLLLTVQTINTGVFLLRTNDYDWVSTRMFHAFESGQPGPSAAAGLCELLAEAAARGIRGFTLFRDFDERVDSRGYPWPDKLERSFQVGTDLLNVVDQLSELAMDLRVSPDMTVHAYIRQGDDFTTGPNPVRFLYGLNVLSMTVVEGGPKPRTQLITRDQVGWTVTDSWAGRASFGLIEGFTQAGGSASEQQTRQLAASVLPAIAQLQRTATLSVIAVDGSVPLRDFVPGDRIQVPAYAGGWQAADVVTIAGAESEAGIVEWTLEVTLVDRLADGAAYVTSTSSVHVDAG